MQKSASLQVFQNKARQTSVRNELAVLILLQAKGGVQLGSLPIPCVRDMKINLFLKNSGERYKHLNENENLHKLHFLHRMFLNGRFWIFLFGMNKVRPLPTYRLTSFRIILTLNYLKLSFKEMRI